jgi:hypothetical protein
VTAIDDEFGHAAGAGLPVVREPAAPAARLAAGQSPGGVLRTSIVPL